jgi:lipopolysaccharide export system protein LptC
MADGTRQHKLDEIAAGSIPAKSETDEAVKARRAARLRTASDFSAQPPPQIEASRGYRRIVGLLKIALPLIALALIATLIVYSVLYRPEGAIAISYSDRGVDGDAVIMMKARFVGSDKNNDPFEVHADRARQDPNDDSLIELNNVDAKLSLQKKGVTLQLKATRGTLDTKNRLLDLVGPITFTSSDGFELHTDEARADLKNGLLTGDKPVEASGPFGTIHADSFEANDTERTAHFSGGVHIHLHPGREGAK